MHNMMFLRWTDSNRFQAALDPSTVLGGTHLPNGTWILDKMVFKNIVSLNQQGIDTRHASFVHTKVSSQYTLNIANFKSFQQGPLKSGSEVTQLYPP